MAKCLASSQSEHGWRAPLNGLSRNGWNVLGRTFLGCCGEDTTDHSGSEEVDQFLVMSTILCENAVSFNLSSPPFEECTSSVRNK
jgi:hypothetical protein